MSRELVGFFAVELTGLSFVIYGLTGVIKRKIVLYYGRWRQKHLGESALIWGMIFIFLGGYMMFVGWALR